MHTAEQFAFDWDRAEAERPIMEQWARNQAAQAWQWTDESLAMVWFLGRLDPEWWATFPRYTRTRVVEQYVAERAALPPGEPLKPYAQLYPPVDKAIIDDHWNRANAMAQQLAADWSANRPPSIFTYDTSLASTVSMILGRRVEAIAPRHLPD